MSGPEIDEERRSTSLKLTIAQQIWVKTRSVEQRCSAADVIEAALIAAGAPAPRVGRNASG